MTENDCAENTSLIEALGNPMWDDAFWTALSGAEEKAKRDLMGLYDESYEGYGCSCDTCVVRTVLEAVWPELTAQFTRLLIAKSEVRTLATDIPPETADRCDRDGGCGRDRCCKG